MRKLLLLVTLAFLFCSCSHRVGYEEGETLYRVGDDLSWAKVGLNDSDWDSLRKDTAGQVFWVRKEVKLIDLPVGRLGLQIFSFGAFDIYWDGVLVGHNGELGAGNKNEVPGSESSIVLIPDSLSTVGKHQVALRMSQRSEVGVDRGVEVKFDNYEAQLRNPLIITAFMNITAGAFFVAGIYFLLLYFNSSKRNISILIFSLICLLFFSLLIIEYLKFYVQIPYPLFYTRLALIGWHTFAISTLVPMYFALQFHFRYKLALVSVVILSLVVIYIFNYGHYDRTAIYYSRMMWFASVVVVLQAVYLKKRGSVLVLTGLLFAALLLQVLVHDFSLFISFCAIMFCMLYLHSLAMKEMELAHEKSLVVSSRLRLALLRKNIQPHFLKNTLTSLIDWVEEAPKEGAKFIQALSEEFDIMNSIAEEQLISILQEIELCKTHIQVMAFRKEIIYEWMTINIDENQQIPPAVFHTMLENGITHTIPVSGKIRFELRYTEADSTRKYTFTTIGENRVSARANREGNGLAYVRARLTESYGDRWKLISEETPNGWMTTINIYVK